MSESKIEERLARLEALLERFLDVKGRDLEQLMEDKVQQAIAEHIEATSTPNNAAADANVSTTFADPIGSSATPRLSLLLQETINAQAAQPNTRSIDRVILDPTRIPASIVELQIQRLEIDYIAEKLIVLKDRMRTSYFIESLDLVTIISPSLMDDFCKTFSQLCLGAAHPSMPESQIMTTIRVSRNITLIVTCLAKMMTCDHSVILGTLSNLQYPICKFDKTKNLITQIYTLRTYIQELSRMFCAILELALVKYPDFQTRNKPKSTAYIFLQVINAKSQLLTSTIEGYCQSFPVDVYKLTHTETITALASLLANKCTDYASNKDFIRINGRFAITALEASTTNKWSAAPSFQPSSYRAPSGVRSPPNHRQPYEKYNISAFDGYDPSFDQNQDQEVDDFDYGLPDDQGVSAIDTDPEAAYELEEENTSSFDYDASIAAVATRHPPSRPVVQTKPELCYQFYWHLIGKSATGCSAGASCPRVHKPELKDTFKTLVQHQAVPPPSAPSPRGPTNTNSPSRNHNPPPRPHHSGGVRFQAPRGPP